MKYIQPTPEEQKRIDEKYYEGQINNARDLNFCYACGHKYTVATNCRVCERPECPRGQNHLEWKAVNDMTPECLLDIVRKIKGIQIDEEEKGVYNVGYRSNGYSIGFKTNKSGLESAVQALLQIGIFGTKSEWTPEGLVYKKRPVIEKDVVRFALVQNPEAIYWEAETVFDSRRVKSSS